MLIEHGRQSHRRNGLIAVVSQVVADRPLKDRHSRVDDGETARQPVPTCVAESWCASVTSSVVLSEWEASVSQSASENRWQSFWNRGGWWKAVLAAVVYIALYLATGAITSTIFAGMIDASNLFSNGASVFFGVALPILIGAILLLLFIWSLGWFREIFGPQPIKGSGWMWIAVVLVVIPIVLHIAATEEAGSFSSFSSRSGDLGFSRAGPGFLEITDATAAMLLG